MQTSQYSIEYCHIYMDEAFNNEHTNGLETLSSVVRSLDSAQSTYSLAVLVDDYNPTDQTLSVDGFIKELASRDAHPDYLGFEGLLVGFGQQLLDSIEKPRIKNMYERYINEKSKSPCSFLVAVWYLMRLGVFKHNRFSPTYFQTGKRPVTMSAQRLINILPDRFAGVEKKAMTLIAATRYAECVERITPVYYKAEANSGSHALV